MNKVQSLVLDKVIVSLSYTCELTLLIKQQIQVQHSLRGSGKVIMDCFCGQKCLRSSSLQKQFREAAPGLLGVVVPLTHSVRKCLLDSCRLSVAHTHTS